MVVVEHHPYSTGSDRLINPNYTLSHRRYPSMPPIKDNVNRGQLLKSQENLLLEQINNTKPYSQKGVKSEALSVVNGQTPSIVSTMISPTLTRKTSHIKRNKGMMNYKEFKSRFFYPVNGPKRRRSRNGKYRNKKELNAIMEYINIDSSISKDLCINQYVRAFELPPNYISKLDPKLKESVKAITIDSNNNYIIYTPNPTTSKNSVISNAEQRLDEELVKLGNPIAFTRKDHHYILPEYRIHRPPLKKFDTVPMSMPTTLTRTMSLPIKFKDEKVVALWNLYLRRVIAERIKWRLLHSNYRDSKLPSSFQRKRDEQRRSSEITDKCLNKNRRFSDTSSVDTNFFLDTLLRNSVGLPLNPTSSSSEDGSKKKKKRRHDRKKRKSKRRSRRVIKREEDSASEPEEPVTDGESVLSSPVESGSPSRRAMYDSLEELMVEMNAIMTDI